MLATGLCLGSGSESHSSTARGLISPQVNRREAYRFILYSSSMKSYLVVIVGVSTLSLSGLGFGVVVRYKY